MRQKLPDRRHSFVRRAKVDGRTVYFCVGLYEDGRPGELFVNVGKYGSEISVWTGSVAVLVSQLLQRGVPLLEVAPYIACSEHVDRLVQVDGHPTISSATGVLDYIAKALVEEFHGSLAEGNSDCLDPEWSAAV